jgi:hypothetical protein
LTRRFTWFGVATDISFMMRASLFSRAIAAVSARACSALPALDTVPLNTTELPTALASIFSPGISD